MRQQTAESRKGTRVRKSSVKFEEGEKSVALDATTKGKKKPTVRGDGRTPKIKKSKSAKPATAEDYKVLLVV